MNLETERVLEDAKSVHNIRDKRGRLVKSATRYLRSNERLTRERDAKQLREQLDPQNLRIANVAADSVDVKDSKRRLQSLEQELDDCSPPQTGLDKDAITRRINEIKEKVVPVMLSREEMRRNPAGAVGKYLRGEASPEIKKLILEAKNLMAAREPNDPDPDLCNIEMWRPEKYVPGGAPTFVAEAQIGGHISYGHIPDQKWEAAGLPLVAEHSPLADMERAELEQLRAEKAERERLHKERQRNYGMSTRPDKVRAKERRLNKSPEERAAQKERQSQMMKARWAAKRAAQTNQTETPTTPNEVA